MITSGQLTIRNAQYHQPWTVPYDDGLIRANNYHVGHLLSSHAVMNGIKSLGKIAAIHEKWDHNIPVKYSEEDKTEIANMSADLVTIAMRFANLHKFNLAKILVERVKEKNGVNILEKINE